MNTTPNEPTPTEDETHIDPTPVVPVEDQSTPEPEEGLGKEAAKYRRRLRETETERDALNVRVEKMQRADVERLTEASRLKGAAFWAAGTKLSDVLDDDGNVDGQKVAQAIIAARETLGVPDPILNGNRAPREGAYPEMNRRSEFDRMADVLSGS